MRVGSIKHRLVFQVELLKLMHRKFAVDRAPETKIEWLEELPPACRGV
jgi:hypothetical protein